jgi:hypothetical protein
MKHNLIGGQRIGQKSKKLAAISVINIDATPFNATIGDMIECTWKLNPQGAGHDNIILILIELSMYNVKI